MTWACLRCARRLSRLVELVGISRRARMIDSSGVATLEVESPWRVPHEEAEARPVQGEASAAAGVACGFCCEERVQQSF